MGKHKIKRFSALRPNPTGLVQDDEFQQNDAFNMQAMSPIKSSEGNSRDIINPFVSSIIEKLQSPSSEERACGCQMLNGVVFQPKAINLLVDQNVARIIYSLFLDTSSDVQINIIGAVRNICIHGSPKICDALVDTDILTPLISVIKKYTNSSTLGFKEAAKTSSLDILIEALKLLSVLCENNPKTVSVFNKENLLQLLLPMMNVENYGYNLPCAVAQCLFVVSENNPEVTACLDTAQFLQIACGDTTETGATLLRTLIIGILLNLKETDVTPHMETIVKNISEVLDIDHIQLLKLTLENQEQAAGKEISTQDAMTSDLDKLLHSQGICLELIANLCCSDDEWEDMDAEEMEDSSDDQAAVGDESATMDEKENFCLQENIGAAFQSHNLMSKIIQKTTPVEKLYIEKLQLFYMGKNVQYKLQELQSRALLCLSNVVSAMDGDTLTKTANLPIIWSNIYSLAETNTYSPKSDEDYKWAVTSAMRALIERMAEFNTSNFSDVTMENLEMLMNIGANSSNHETQINVMRVLSTIGCVLSTNLPPHPLLTKIGLILIEVALKNENIVVVSEALDCIFDVFKEDQTDIVTKEIELVNKLKSLESGFKQKISNQRKQLGENYGVVMMAKANLKAYIKYKTGN